MGPAGRELDRALEVVGIERGDVYITNVVKHFKFEERGKRRIHQRPKRGEVNACKPWFDAELRLIRPRALVMLGATAAQALLGSGFRLSRHRGELFESSRRSRSPPSTHRRSCGRPARRGAGASGGASPPTSGRSRPRSPMTRSSALRDHRHSDRLIPRGGRGVVVGGDHETAVHHPESFLARGRPRAPAEPARRQARRIQVLVLAPLLAGVLVAYGYRDDIFGEAYDTPVRILTAVALVILGWQFARDVGRSFGPLLFRRLDPGTAGDGPRLASEVLEAVAGHAARSG